MSPCILGQRVKLREKDHPPTMACGTLRDPVVGPPAFAPRTPHLVDLQGRKCRLEPKCPCCRK